LDSESGAAEQHLETAAKLGRQLFVTLEPCETA
jgi:NAD(P)H dehydrogenase (quinone)